VYQFEATVYEDQHHPSCYAELWVGSQDFRQLLMSAHLAGEYADMSGSVSHEEMVSLFERVLGEIAQNLTELLF